MFFFFKNNRLLFERITDYLETADQVMERFDETIHHWMKHDIDARFLTLMESTARSESEADDIHLDLKKLLYLKSLLPESREDVLVLTDKTDDVIDAANHTLQYIYSHNIHFPKFLKDDMKELLRITLEAYRLLRETILDLFQKRVKIQENCRLIGNNEHLADKLKLKMTKEIFDSDLSGFDKILLRDGVRSIDSLCDYCEAAANLITLLNIKRLV